MENVEQYHECATRTYFKILVPLKPGPSDPRPSPSYDNTFPRHLRRLDRFWSDLEVVLLGGMWILGIYRVIWACIFASYVGEKLSGWRLKGYLRLLVEEASSLKYPVSTCLHYSFLLLKFPLFSLSV